MVRIGLTDTGLNPKFLKYGIITDWIDLINNQPNPYDDHDYAGMGHGTYVATIIENIIHRLEPNEPIEFVVAKVCHASGVCDTQPLFDGLDFVRTRNVTAVNTSIGGLLPSDSIDGFHTNFISVTKRVHDSGAVHVVAGGNGYGQTGVLPYLPIPNMSFITDMSDSPWVLSAGWTMIGAGWNTDIVEDSDCGSSFSTPQATAKAALVNQRVGDVDLTMEALMTTSSPPTGYPGQSQPSYPGPTGYCNFDPLCRYVGLCVTQPYQQYLGVCAPGKCGWGYPRYTAALNYAKHYGTSQWFKAGDVPSFINDTRWAAWVPGYLVRLRHNSLRLDGCHGMLNSAVPSPAFGGIIQTGVAFARVRTLLGDVDLAGYGPVTNQQNISYLGDLVLDQLPLAAYWGVDGNFIMYTNNGTPFGSKTLSVDFIRDSCQIV